MLTAIRPLLDDLKPQRHSSRGLYVFGGFWIFSALVHTGLLAATGFEWSGCASSCGSSGMRSSRLPPRFTR